MIFLKKSTPVNLMLNNPTYKNKKMITDINLLGLSEEQIEIFEKIIQGKNVFLTGSAGTGKSFLIQAIKKHLPSIKAARENPEWAERIHQVNTNNIRTVHMINSSNTVRTINVLHSSNETHTILDGCPRLIRVRVVALTGCAAILLGQGAKTLHSWAGIGKGQETVSELATKIRRSSRANRNWLTTDVLIIDEISMLTGELLEKLDALAKRLRASNQPFGGIQVVFVGDFFQLPPVVKEKDSHTNVFAFQSPIWQTIISHQNEIHLHKIHRQNDPVFQRILLEARYGKLSQESCKILESRMGLNWQSARIRPTLLFPRRAEVDMINENNLRAITGIKYTYKADITFSEKFPIETFNKNNPEFVRILESMDREAPYLAELTLAKDAQVMLIYNLDLERGLSNGSRGVVVGFDETAANIPIVEFTNGMRIPIGRQSWEIEDYVGVLRTQIPLRLAYACTIHKSQGASIDCALIDIGTSTFEYGQAYVALSRVRSLEGLYIHEFVPGAVRAHPDVFKRFENNYCRPNEDPE